jgi:hypothetical protein
MGRNRCLDSFVSFNQLSPLFPVGRDLSESAPIRRLVFCTELRNSKETF